MAVAAGVYFYGNGKDDAGNVVEQAYCNRAAATPNGVPQGRTFLSSVKEKQSLVGVNDDLVMDPADQSADVEGVGSCSGKSVQYTLHLDGSAQHISWIVSEIGSGALVWTGGMPAAGLNLKLVYPAV